MKTRYAKISRFLSVGALGTGGLALVVFTSPANLEAVTSIPQLRIEDDRDETTETSQTKSSANDLVQVAEITLSRAVQIAETFAEGSAVEAELERENGNIVYSVSIGNQEIIVDANTGEILDTETDDEDDAELQQRFEMIPLQQAIQAAEAFVEGQAASAELEVEDGGLVYEVEIGDQEIYIDAGNGRVLYTEGGEEETEGNRPLSSIQVPRR
ncbi:MAG: PepSY domain-containing protein [Elainellaceae cyanobacterium]